MPLFCAEDAPLPPEAEPAPVSPADDQRNRSLSPDNGSISLTTLDGRPISRGEVIQRLKRGESPTWSIKFSPQPSPRPTPRESPQPALLPSPNLNDPDQSENYMAGLEIERPRSALHSGDFHENKRTKTQHETLDNSLSPPWRSPFFSPPRLLRDEYASRPAASPPNQLFLPPTSPLFHAHSNHDDMADRRSSYSLQMAQSIPTTPPRYISSHPFRAHQPRQSISIPQTPSRLRGISISSDASPLHQSPMVGSYEESILRGRMSTTPSKPLDFIAQIGVLGYGKCKPSLQCPRHVTVSFPAVFYSYGSSGPALDNQPSPYVGLIDVEHSFPPYDSKSPPGGCYRIPRQGQLQIILKNPNKTAVKLFLVPYDLGDMQPGQKTFIRQRSYSTGPIIDMPLNGNSKESSTDTPTLRYLIHLHICCPARGRYFLYKSIRVVFANRVPDGKEHLRNEVQYPEPKYAAYKPSSDSGPSAQKAMAASLSRDKAARRRSTPFHFGMGSLDAMDGIGGDAAAAARYEAPYRTAPRPRPEYGFGPVGGAPMLAGPDGRGGLSVQQQVDLTDGIPLGVGDKGELGRARGDDVAMADGPREASFQLR